MLEECLRALRKQTLRQTEVVVVDNSGGQADLTSVVKLADAVIVQRENVGFGAALNRVFRNAQAAFVATINDDAVAHPEWLEKLLEAAETHPEVGMFASCVVLATGQLDSAGMLICGDGSSKQRGHRQAVESYQQAEEVLCPSGSAALYRRHLFEDVGWFDEEFFLYGEDTDLGLRARWAGWSAWYVPQATVVHRYSQSTGAASALKAYLVERNRLRILWKNFPARLLLCAPVTTLKRYYWHWVAWRRGQGLTGQFARQPAARRALAAALIRAHWDWLRQLPGLMRARREIQRRARLSAREFEALVRRFSISPRRIAEL